MTGIPKLRVAAGSANVKHESSRQSAVAPPAQHKNIAGAGPATRRKDFLL